MALSSFFNKNIKMSIKVYQLSTPRCNPCNAIKKYMQGSESAKILNYRYVDLTKPPNSDEIDEVLKNVKVSSVPHFVVTRDGKVEDQFIGGGIKAQDILENLAANEAEDYYSKLKKELLNQEEE